MTAAQVPGGTGMAYMSDGPGPADNTGIPGGMAAILTAHQPFGSGRSHPLLDCVCGHADLTLTEFAAHQAAALTAAGYGNTTALLNDLRELADSHRRPGLKPAARSMSDSWRRSIRAVIARHTQEGQ